MAEREIPVRLSIGNVNAQVVGSLARSPHLVRSLADLLRALADEIDPTTGRGEGSGAGASEDQQ